MVNFTYITAALAATVSGAVASRAPETSAATFTQAMQELQCEEDKCNKHSTALHIVNKCTYAVHVWRADSSVDKAAILTPGGSLNEPFRQDWRSGLVGYRISTADHAPYDTNGNGVTVINYVHKRTAKSGTIAGQVNHIFGNPFADEKLSLWASGWGGCNQDLAKIQDQLGVDVHVVCNGSLGDSGFEVGFTLCA